MIFEEITHYFRNNFGSPFPNKRRFNGKLPIWWEFIQHVINTNPREFDNHYKPIYLLCGTCGYQYNYILKFETIKAEEPYFIADIGATGRNILFDKNDDFKLFT